MISLKYIQDQEYNLKFYMILSKDMTSVLDQIFNSYSSVGITPFYAFPYATSLCVIEHKFYKERKACVVGEIETTLLLFYIIIFFFIVVDFVIH